MLSLWETKKHLISSYLNLVLLMFTIDPNYQMMLLGFNNLLALKHA